MSECVYKLSYQSSCTKLKISLLIYLKERREVIKIEILYPDNILQSQYQCYQCFEQFHN